MTSLKQHSGAPVVSTTIPKLKVEGFHSHLREFCCSQRPVPAPVVSHKKGDFKETNGYTKI